jgi:small conductance mechanosensitive channel
VAFCVLAALPALAQAQTAETSNPDIPARIIDQGITTEELELRLVPLPVDELQEVVAVWQGYVKAKSQEVADTQVGILQSEGPVADAIRQKLASQVETRQRLLRNYSAAVRAWEKKGGSKEEITTAKAYANTILFEETRTSDIAALAIRVTAWVTDAEGGLGLLIKVVIIVVALVALFIVARMVRSLARRGIHRIPHLSQLLAAFFLRMIYWLTVAIGLLIVLSALGVDIMPLFALMGGAAFVMAFALQDTLGNLAAGLMIMIYRPFDVGDYVTAGGVSGTVRSVSIVSTTVTTPDNQVIVIPNKSVWGSVITNVNTRSTRRVDLTFGIGYGDDIEQAQAVLEDIVTNHDLILKDPAPVVRLHALADSSVNFVCRTWVNTSDYWTVYWDLHRSVKIRFDKEGISIPFPQQEIHIHGLPNISAKAVEDQK